MPGRAATDLEADLAALKCAADRAGRALACVFASSDEYEAAVIRERRAQGAFGPQHTRTPRWRIAALTAALALTFLML